MILSQEIVHPVQFQIAVSAIKVNGSALHVKRVTSKSINQALLKSEIYNLREPRRKHTFQKNFQKLEVFKPMYLISKGSIPATNALITVSTVLRPLDVTVVNFCTP